MPKVITFSTNVSAGHRRAAEAVARAILAVAPDARIVERDALNLVGPGRRRFLTDTYLGILKYKPSLWNHLYHNKSIKRGIAGFFRLLLAEARETFEAEIERNEPDVIICTQAIPAKIIAELKSRGRVTAPLLAVATDYGIHPYWTDAHIDSYAVPCPEAARELAADGVSPERIHVTGIPVDSVFENPPSREESRRALGLRPDATYVLAIGGGNGLGLEIEHIQEIERAPGVDGVIVIAGCNDQLWHAARSLPTVAGKERHIHSMVMGIEKFYAAADILVSKPGGLTMSEATAMAKPIIMISPLPGQEVRNAKFLERVGAALNAETAADLGRLLPALVADPLARQRLSEAARVVGQPEASRRIASMALALAAETRRELVHA